MGIAIAGVIEQRVDGEWIAVREVDHTDFPRNRVADTLFGFRESSPREDRGIPDDASDTVLERYEQQKRELPGRDGHYRHQFGHTYVRRDEVPDECQEYASVLWEVDSPDRDVRAVVWASN